MFLRLVIAALLGITLKSKILALEWTDMDTISYYTAQATLALTIVFFCLTRGATWIMAKEIPEIRAEELREIRAAATLEAKSKLHEERNKDAPSLAYPDWYTYYAELFKGLDHKSMMSLQTCSHFLARRMLFVCAALYLSGSTAL